MTQGGRLSLEAEGCAECEVASEACLVKLLS